MTRLEPAGEPSMEDILASIRKIIAEDPPGSRAVPDVHAEPASPSVADRIFQRLGETARSEPAKPAAATEPYLRSAMPSLSSTPSADSAKPFDIDAQMAEVLSKTRGMAQRRDIEPSFDSVVTEVQGADVQAALDSLQVAPNLGLSTAPQPRPGFTVARDGFVPEAPLNAQLNAQVGATRNDPFEFSLGPSPFAARAESKSAPKSAPAPAIETAMPDVRDTRYQDFGTFVPTRPVLDPVLDDATRSETQAAANLAAATHATAAANDAPSPIETRAAEEPMAQAAQSPEPRTADATANGVTSPEAIAAQLKDFETAINAPGLEPVATAESVETVLAELKLKLDQASAPERVAAVVVSEPEPFVAAAAAETEVAASEPVAAASADFAPELDPVAPAAAAAEPDAATTEVSDAANVEMPFADFVSIAEPAPIAAPEIVRELDREPVRETAQEMVVAEPLAELHPENSAPPFHAMHMPAMQNSSGPGARSMEDTVAELLRPMLRSWLSENMPKIVERALRKEIDDSLHSEHKTAAE